MICWICRRECVTAVISEALRRMASVSAAVSVEAPPQPERAPPEVVELLVERGYSPVNGARYLQREIEKK